MNNEQKLKMQIAKKENVIRLNSNEEIFNLLGISLDEYEKLSVNDKFNRLEAIVKENSWKGQRKTAEQKKKDKEEADFNNTFDALKDILVNGTKEEKDILLGVIRKHQTTMEISKLEKEKKAIDARLKELKGE